MSNQNQKQPKGNNRAAATHSGGIRSEAKKTRVVFKNVLDTPFNIPWPEVTSENNAIVLETLCDLLKPIKGYHNNHTNKDSTKILKTKKTKKPTKDDSLPKSNPALATTNHDTTDTTSISNTPAPAILNSVIIGINAVTKSLERSIQNLASHSPPSAVFLCKGDLAPSHLYSHLGPMIAMLPGVKLFPLLRGSEKSLSESLGMQAVGALAIKAGEGESKEAEDLLMILDRMVEPINVSWLPKVKKPITTNASNSTGKKVETAVPSKPETKETVQPTSTLTEATSVSTITTEVSESIVSKTEISSGSESFIATNIKSVKTTMPIVVKTPKPATPGQENQKNNNNNNNSNSNSNNTSNNKGKNQQQQKQQQQQSNQSKGKKHPSDNQNHERNNNSKKPRAS
ncbi:hypothetical protein BGZ46_005276 [Entomortierella lignicola]|nr:hypothetical protein BGZ46_005276 [Entomortierella lignicola]